MQGQDPFLKKLRVSRVQSVSRNAVTLTLEPVGWKPAHRAGQFLTLVFETPRGEKRRSYSITSDPGAPLQITIKKIDNGEFSRPLNYHTRPGDLLFTTGIAGSFVLPDEPHRFDYAFVAAGSGITPCLPMIRELLHNTGRQVALICSNRSRADAIFLEELEQLAHTFAGRFRLYTLFSDSGQLSTRRLSKWLLDDLLKEMTPMPGQTLYYLCGPFEFMQMCRISILSITPKAHLRTESFDHTPRSVLSRPPDEDGHRVRVLAGSQAYDLNVQFPVAITQTAAAMGIRLPYSCEAGRCGSCAATVSKGKMWMAYNEVLTDKEVASGRVLACQAFPLYGDAEIRFD